ncbi:CPG4 domain-containing protein [Aphelenchoides fujianensis]|nr:CPG4 domain-containing protein [Aphelenchoides fujianensis]
MTAEKKPAGSSSTSSSCFVSSFSRVLAFLALLVLSGTVAFPDDCTDSCVSRMQMMLDTIPPTRNTSWNLQQRSMLNKTPFKPEGESVVTMQKFFSTVCQSYESVESCLEKCGSNSKQLLMVKQTYSGLRLICKDHRKDFFSALPCLTQYEPMAMSKCSQEIHQSHVTTANFTEAIVNREFYSIRLKFRFLCKDLSAMINCMEPIVREGCGDRSTNLMLHFITLEFSSFEQLYSQLAFNEPLPHHCRSLLSLSHGRTGLFTQNSYVMHYPSGMVNASAPTTPLLPLLLILQGISLLFNLITRT